MSVMRWGAVKKYREDITHSDIKETFCGDSDRFEQVSLDCNRCLKTWKVDIDGNTIGVEVDT